MMKYPHTFASLDGTTPLPFVWQSAWGALHIDLFSITKLHDYPQSSLRSATLKSDGRQRVTAEAASVGGPVCRCRRRRGGCGRSFTSTEPSDHTLSGIAFRLHRNFARMLGYAQLSTARCCQHPQKGRVLLNQTPSTGLRYLSSTEPLP